MSKERRHAVTDKGRVVTWDDVALAARQAADACLPPYQATIAKAAAAAPASADDDDDDTSAPAADETGQDEGDESQPEVIATILCYPDGSYGLTQGDENEEEPGGESEGGSEPQRFGSVGELLHGVMQTVKDYESTKSGEGSEAENFKSGFSGTGMKTQSQGGY